MLATNFIQHFTKTAGETLRGTMDGVLPRFIAQFLLVVAVRLVTFTAVRSRRVLGLMSLNGKLPS